MTRLTWVQRMLFTNLPCASHLEGGASQFTSAQYNIRLTCGALQDADGTGLVPVAEYEGTTAITQMALPSSTRYVARYSLYRRRLHP